MNAKQRKRLDRLFDWDKYTEVQFVVMMYSTELGWLEFDRPAPELARKRYDDCDCKQKYLLNYGMVVAENKPTEG